jgi:hypothetical protein
VHNSIKCWVACDDQESLLAQAFESHLDARGTPDRSKCVPFEEIDGLLRIQGVGPESKKIGMSQRKLAVELTRLGYASETARVGRKTRKVRYGLSARQQEPDAALEADHGL